jgi:mRNA interferase RelE/StbE
VVAPAAERALSERLPESAAAAAVEFINGPLLTPPRRVGHELLRDLAGTWSARRGAYRVLYDLDDDARTVRVLLVEHRSTVYRRR